MAFGEKMVLSVFGVCMPKYDFKFLYIIHEEIFNFDIEGINYHYILWTQLLIISWMTRRITDDIPGWGALFHGRVGDGSVSVNTVFSLEVFNSKVITPKFDLCLLSSTEQELIFFYNV